MVFNKFALVLENRFQQRSRYVVHPVHGNETFGQEDASFVIRRGSTVVSTILGRFIDSFDTIEEAREVRSRYEAASLVHEE